MKRIRNIFFVAFIMMISSLAANAQQKGGLKLDLNYNYSIPLGSFKNDIISNASPRGVTGDLMYGINNKWAAGLQLGFQDFYQKYPRDLYKTGNNEVTSAVLSNSVQTMPVLLKGVFTPLGNSGSLVQPYISAATGFNIIDFRQYLGEFGSSSNSAAFTAQAGAGVMMPFRKNSGAGFSVGADYNYVSYTKFGYNNLNNISLRAGIHFPLK